MVVVRVTVVQVLQSWPVIVAVEVVMDVQDDWVVSVSLEVWGMIRVWMGWLTLVTVAVSPGEGVPIMQG
jgi:hypothetical protein